MRVGGESAIQVDVRVITATNQNLRYLVDSGRFRRDLYYRLNVLGIDLPPLRERKADIPLLVESFIRHASKEHDRPEVSISAEAMALLMRYEWPGNVRELKNLIESMVVLSPGRVIMPQDIPPEIRTATPGHLNLLPAPIPRAEGQNNTPTPELEFIFRTLIQLRIDVEDLRRQFDDYRQNNPDLPTSMPVMYPAIPMVPSGRAIDVSPVESNGNHVDDADEESTIVYRPGVTIAELEKEAITAALRQVAGNRRKAAEMLGMGERTLYRKIKEYGIPL